MATRLRALHRFEGREHVDNFVGDLLLPLRPIFGGHLVQMLLDVPLGPLHRQQPARLLAGNGPCGCLEQPNKHEMTDERGEQPIEAQAEGLQAARRPSLPNQIVQPFPVKGEQL